MAHSTQGATVSKPPLQERRDQKLSLPCPVTPFIGDSEVSAAAVDEILTYWLIPAEPALRYFRTVIRDLAVRLDAPAFEPHVTLYVTKAADENPARVFGDAVPHPQTFRLSVVGLDCSDKFTKTLYVQFEPDAALQRLSDSLRAASVIQSDYELKPHVSLIYKTMAREQKREIMKSLTLPFTEVDFDLVKAVISPAKIESREDVEAWRVAATLPLRR